MQGQTQCAVLRVVSEHGGPAGAKASCFPETELLVQGPPLGVGGISDAIFTDKRKHSSLFPLKKAPIMGTMRICGTPPALVKIRHLAHTILSFYFQYHLQMYLLFFKKKKKNKIKSFFVHDMIVPEQALKNPAVIASVHKH